MSQEYLNVNDITSRGSLIYTTGTGSGSAKWGSAVLNIDSNRPYLACHDTSGNFLFSNTYDASYVCTELVTGSTALFGVGANTVKAFDFSGNALWIRAATGAATLAWDSTTSSIYVAGTFTGSVTLGATTLTSTGSDAYLARYDASGTLLSAINVSSSLQTALNSLVVVPSAIQRVGTKTYIAGTFGGALAFSSTTVTADTSYKAGFVLVVNTLNQIEWVKTIDAQFLDRIYDIDIQGTTIYVAGSYAQRTLPLELNDTIALPGKVNNSAEGYIAALDLSGAYLWVHKVGCNIAGGNAAQEQSKVSSIVASASNNLYFTGNFATNPLYAGDMSLSFVNTTRQAYVGYLTATPTNPPAPGAPLDVSAVIGNSFGEVIVSWSKNYDEGPTASYRVYYKLATSPTYTSYVDSSASPATVTGLAGQLYDFAVVAVGPLGSTSAFSSAAQAQPPSGAPSAPLDLSATAVTSSSITIQWTANPASLSAATYYTVYYKVANRINWDSTINVLGTTTTLILTGLQSNQEYRIAVAAYNTSGGSALSDVIIPRTLLGKPTGIAAQVAYNNVTMFWNPIGNVSGYRVFYALAAGFNAAAPVWDASLNFANVVADITGLNSFTDYAFAVAALVDGVVGELSTIIYRSTFGVPPTPSEPRFPRMNVGDGRVTLSWNYPWKPPAFVSIVDGYKIYKKAATDASYSLAATVGAVLSHVVTDLSNGTPYSFYIAAYNAAGDGTPSDIIEGTPFNPTVPIITAVADPIVEPGAGSVLVFAASLPGATNTDEQAFTSALAAIAETGTSELYKDTATDTAAALIYVPELEAKKASAPTSIVIDSESTKVTNVVPPPSFNINFLSVAITPARPALLPVGTNIVFNPATDVELNVVKYDASRVPVSSVLDASNTYTTVQFKRTYPVINIYKDIAGTYTKLITLYGTTTVPQFGIRQTKGRCLGGNMITGYQYEFTGPFSSVFITNGTQSSVDTGAVPCLVRGTRLLTPTGYRAVEDLYAGDELTTADGRVVNITQAYESVIESCSAANGAWSIPRGFFGKGSAAVTVSPNHAVKVPGTNNWFIPGYATKEQKARMKQAAEGSRMEYYHIELPNYLQDDMVLEGGAVVESYGTRWSKENAAAIQKAGGAVYTWSPKAKYFTRLQGAAVTRLQGAVVRKLEGGSKGKGKGVKTNKK
jgi:hypothetical protein